MLEAVSRPHAERVFDEIANELGSEDLEYARAFLRRND